MSFERNYCYTLFVDLIDYINELHSRIDYRDYEDLHTKICWLYDSFLKCGEPLAEPKPLTLEELRVRNGKPVYISNLSTTDDNGEWIIIEQVAGNCLWATDEYNYYKMKDYNKIWLAYDREVKNNK